MSAISGKFYKADGVTLLSANTFYISVTDTIGNPAGSFGPFSGGTYTLTVPAIAPADKRVTFKVIEGGQPKTTVANIDGNPQRPQIVDILVPD